MLELGGPRALFFLCYGFALDLHPDAFPVDTVAATRLSLVDVVLVAVAADTFRILVRSAQADWLVTWLLDAAVEYEQGVPA